ncbi:MAG: SLBB domain-containing protein [Oscillospiraceae bacterium]|nr:SLBB domain-containing protein [Oscillospiraceae bacterium]
MAKSYLLKGDVNRPGRISVEKGMTLRQIVDELGGGMANGKAFKAMQIGGPSGGLVTAEQLDLPLDYKALAEWGCRRGDGVITVMDEDRCMVDAAYSFLRATQADFCGKCISCREGTKRMSELMGKLVECKADESDVGMMLELGEVVHMTAFCALGKGSGSTLRVAAMEFSDDFQNHIEGACPLCAKETRLPVAPGDGIPYDRKQVRIDPNKCKGCSRCSRACHAEAISGVLKSPYSIDQSKCVKCYTCIELCAFGAIEEVTIDG